MTVTLPLRAINLLVCICMVLLNNAFAASSHTQPNPDPQVLNMGLAAYQWAFKHASVRKPYLILVNFSLPSKQKRLWVVNVHTQDIVLSARVANGKNSGLYKGESFSNLPNSLKSSLGIYLTGSNYYGTDGLSMHVYGLQRGINNNAYSRDIEFHAAPYVSEGFAKRYHRVGRSWGCFAVNKKVLPTIINLTKNGSVVFAYADHHPEIFKAFYPN